MNLWLTADIASPNVSVNITTSVKINFKTDADSFDYSDIKLFINDKPQLITGSEVVLICRKTHHLNLLWYKTCLIVIQFLLLHLKPSPLEQCLLTKTENIPLLVLQAV